MKMENYKNLDFEIYVRLHDLQNILAHYQVEDSYFEMIKNHMELIRTKQFRVAVIGEFSRGKSSLLNALLGGRILPADITPTTATINRIAFDMDPRVEICYRDNTSEIIDINALSDYVTKLTEQGEQIAETISEAVIYYPTVICQNNIDLIDTPGLNEDEKMTRLTVEQLERIDAAVVLISALSPVDQVEAGLISSLIESPEIECLVFVVSFIDCIDPVDQDRVMQIIRERISKVANNLMEKYGPEHEIAIKAKRILANIELYAVSSEQALKAMETNNRSLLIKSRFLDFQKALYRILASQQQKNATVKTLRMLAEAGEHLDIWYEEKRERLEQRHSLAKMRAQQVAVYYAVAEDSVKQFIQEEIKSDDQFFKASELAETYEKICISGLSTLYENEVQHILEGIHAIDCQINDYTDWFMEQKAQQLRIQGEKFLDIFMDFRDKNLCQPIRDFDPEEAGKQEAFIGTIRQQIKNYPKADSDKYQFFQKSDEKVFCLNNSKLQQKYQYFLADPRHCNYIAFMKETTAQYAADMRQIFSKWKSQFVEMLWSVWRSDEQKREEIHVLTEQWIKNCKDDIVVNEKLYTKHQAQLAEMEQYAKETIKSIREEGI